MNGRRLLNNTLKVNAVFSLISGLDFIFLNRTIAQVLSGEYLISLVPIGVMLVGFAVFVFAVSMLKHVNKYLVGTIIAMDAMWVLGSVTLVIAGYTLFTTVGLILILTIAAIIALFAFFQTKGLILHLKDQTV